MRALFVLLLATTLAGCAGSSACQVFSPTPADTPTAKEEQRVEVQSTGDPTLQSHSHDEGC
jgi:hypothetical protein